MSKQVRGSRPDAFCAVNDRSIGDRGVGAVGVAHAAGADRLRSARASVRYFLGVCALLMIMAGTPPSFASNGPEPSAARPVAVQATLRVCKSGCEYDAIQPALDAAENGDTILVGSGLYPGGVVVRRSVRIRGVGPDSTRLDAQGASMGAFIAEGVRVTIAGLTITGGVAESGGGVINRGALTLRDVWIVGNRARSDDGGFSVGGGIYNFRGSLTLRDSIVEDNEAPSAGGIYTIGTTVIQTSVIRANRSGSDAGGILNYDGTLLLHQSRVTDNRAEGQGTGGGIYNFGVTTISYGLVDGNTSGSFGGGIYQRRGGVYATSSTISNNEAATAGGGLYLLAGESDVTSATLVGNGASLGAAITVAGEAELRLQNTIVANSSGSNCLAEGEIESFGFNLDSGNTCGFDEIGDLVNTQPMIGDLADHGGETPTHALLEGSPAIDAGDDAGCLDYNGYDLPADQRGRARHIDGDGDGFARCDIGAFELDPDEGVVEPPEPVACEGPTVCAAGCDHPTIASAADTVAAGETVCLTEGRYEEAVTLDRPVRIQGAGSALTTLTAPAGGPVLRVRDGATVELAHIAVVDASGIVNEDGDLTLSDCEVRGHTAPADSGDANGSGVVNGGTLTVRGCTIAENVSFRSGGGIDSIAGTVTVEDSVIRDNTAAETGGAVSVGSGGARIERSVLQANEATSGGGIYAAGPLTVAESSLVDNLATFGGAIIASGEAQVSSSSFQRNRADLGGALYASGEEASVTIEGSDLFENVATGEFGFGGAIYVSDADITVRGGRLSENVATNGGAVTSRGTLTLDEVLLRGNRSNFGGALLQYEGTTTVTGGSWQGNIAFGAGGAGYLAAGDVQVDGTAISDNTSVGDGGGIVLREGSSLTMDGSDVSNNTAEWAGAFYNRGGELVFRDGRITDNAATGGVADDVEDPEEEPEDRPGLGGALLHEAGTVRMERSSVTGNGATRGGAIYNQADLWIRNSTISGNGADDGGGGLFAADGQARLAFVTIADNTADPAGSGGGAVATDGGGVRLGHAIVGPSLDVPSCAGEIESAGYNLGADSSCGFSAVGDREGVDPLITELDDHGGGTLTHDLRPGSPAIDAADPDGCVDLEGATVVQDQRSVSRPLDGDEDGEARCDIGAVELDPAPEPTPEPTPPDGTEIVIYLPSAQNGE